jgi:hypothetical protein
MLEKNRFQEINCKKTYSTQINSLFLGLTIFALKKSENNAFADLIAASNGRTEKNNQP